MVEKIFIMGSVSLLNYIYASIQTSWVIVQPSSSSGVVPIPIVSTSRRTAKLL